jgi:hypothetical protein
VIAARKVPKFAQKWLFGVGLNAKNLGQRLFFADCWAQYFIAKRPVFRA